MSGEPFTHTPYLRTFAGDLSPAMLRMAAALNGFPPPPAHRFDYCELGAGNGDTTATLAAAYPEARFVGVDLNPEHVAFATSLASRGGLTNVRFLERDFEALARDTLPAFDFIGAHGVLSWISPAKRRALWATAAARLKPGGLFHVSYNALPGWAALEPLRRLLQQAAGSEGSSLERARRGLGLARILSDAGASYFVNNPAARSMLDTMSKAGLPYVVHEYLQPDWHPLYFADAAREAAEHGLHFIGQLPLHLNYRDLSLPPALLALFQSVNDRLTFEGLKDFALNEFFRRDVYLKGVVPRDEAHTAAYLGDTPFGSLAIAEKILREVRLPHCTLRFAGPLFDALIPALAAQSSTLAELAAQPALASFGAPKIREAILHLALAGQIVPMRRSTLPVARSSVVRPGRCHVPLAYNRMILEQRLSPEVPIVLASEPAGNGLIVSMLEAVCLRLVTEAEPAERPARLRAFVERQPLKLQVLDKPIEGPDEQARVLAGELAQFCEKRLPKLIALGIVAPGAQP